MQQPLCLATTPLVIDHNNNQTQYKPISARIDPHLSGTFSNMVADISTGSQKLPRSNIPAPFLVRTLWRGPVAAPAAPLRLGALNVRFAASHLRAEGGTELLPP